MAKADLKYYQDAAGHVFSMTEADAKKLGGYTPADMEKVKAANAAGDAMRMAAADDARFSEREKALAEREAEIDKREKALAKAK